MDGADVMESRESFADWLRELNWIEKGDCVYVISDMLEPAKASRECGSALNMNELIDRLQELTGREGTLLFPVFNWDFCKGIGFDYRRTPARTGALSKAALKRADFVRTAHPMYSFAVWGAHSRELAENRSRDAFGPGTIFEQLYNWGAKALALGLPALRGLTYIHHVEQLVGVPYRYHKEFTADYTDADGVCSSRTYRMFVRDLERNPRHIDGFRPLEEKMRRDGCISTAYYGTAPCHLVKLSDLDLAVREDILENDSRNMYQYEKMGTR